MWEVERWLTGARDDFEGGDGVEFPGRGAPIARAAGGGVEGLIFVLGVEEEPAADADPAALEMVAERRG